MKGQQNKLEIIQKVKRNDDQVKRIITFENNDYLKTKEIYDHLKYEFPQSEYLSLAQLIESIKYNFIKIYKGQILIIIQSMLEHLLKLHYNIQISHGKLIPQNIIIKLKYDKSNQLTIIQTKFQIEKIHFVNYRLIDDINYQINNYFQDVDDIIDCSIALIQPFSNQKCQLLQCILNTLNDYKKDKKMNVLYSLFEFIQSSIQEYVDKENYKVKNKEIQLSVNINKSNPQSNKCEEFEEYGMLSKRNRLQKLIYNFIEEIQFHDITTKLNKSGNQINESVSINESIFDQSQLKSQDEIKIFEVFQKIIQQQIMRISWEKYGTFLESWDLDTEKLQEQTFKDINLNNEAILNKHLSKVLQEFQNVQSINNEIKEEIEKNYRFDILYDETKAKEIFILELMIESQNYDFQNIQSFIKKVKSNVKSELQEYYNDILMYEILNLINDLI
ncbi:unnamed protein product [Paramecium sonneborni]|uniref:Uncharacterized protein n=1 Tax=Paramecium sonneborni TaxID=65129 RepID=A0A8S1LD53_9CILI|nr:unnamed protein product [Paramecium sonneborni]